MSSVFIHTAMPANDALFEASMAVFSRVRPYMDTLVALGVAWRVITYFVEPGNRYPDLARDVLVYFGAMALFPLLFRQVIELSFALGTEIGTGDEAPISKQMDGSLDLIGSWLISILYNVMHTLHSVGIALIGAMAPLIILLSTILNLDIGLKILVTLLLMLCSWPIVYSILGHLGYQFILVGLQSGMSDISLVVTSSVIVLLQLLSPFILTKVLRTGSVIGPVKDVIRTGSRLIRGAGSAPGKLSYTSSNAKRVSKDGAMRSYAQYKGAEAGFKRYQDLSTARRSGKTSHLDSIRSASAARRSTVKKIRFEQRGKGLKPTAERAAEGASSSKSKSKQSVVYTNVRAEDLGSKYKQIKKNNPWEKGSKR